MGIFRLIHFGSHAKIATLTFIHQMIVSALVSRIVQTFFGCAFREGIFIGLNNGSNSSVSSMYTLTCIRFNQRLKPDVPVNWIQRHPTKSKTDG
jgi:hypothetical protein